ncbi:hypothetical protein MKW92_027153 [Papaver armeniacum]|nr:hypothetical protein MKW92_027153 [Papaver armeniacum]
MNLYYVFVNIVDTKYVMVLLKGSVPMLCCGSEENIAFGELTSIGGINSDVNKKLSAAVAAILKDNIFMSKSRFFINHSFSHWSNACLHQH